MHLINVMAGKLEATAKIIVVAVKKASVLPERKKRKKCLQLKLVLVPTHLDFHILLQLLQLLQFITVYYSLLQIQNITRGTRCLSL